MKLNAILPGVDGRAHAPACELRREGGARERDGEPRAAAHASAFGSDGAAVQFDQVLDDREPESQAGRGIRFALPERLKDVRQEVRMDADAGVADRHHDGRRRCA